MSIHDSLKLEFCYNWRSQQVALSSSEVAIANGSTILRVWKLFVGKMMGWASKKGDHEHCCGCTWLWWQNTEGW